MTPQGWTNMSIALLLVDTLINFFSIIRLQRKVEKLEKTIANHHIIFIAQEEKIAMLNYKEAKP